MYAALTVVTEKVVTFSHLAQFDTEISLQGMGRNGISPDDPAHLSQAQVRMRWITPSDTSCC